MYILLMDEIFKLPWSQTRMYLTLCWSTKVHACQEVAIANIKVHQVNYTFPRAFPVTALYCACESNSRCNEWGLHCNINILAVSVYRPALHAERENCIKAFSPV